MTEPTTCGEGLAAHAALHDRLATLYTAVARNLELHLTSLDPDDEASRPEVEAYADLEEQHRAVAERLGALGGRMAACRDLPMADHNAEALMSVAVIDAFRELVAAQEGVVDLLQGWIRQEREMLAGLDG
jgi:hypothetical protein